MIFYCILYVDKIFQKWYILFINYYIYENYC